MGRYEIGGSKCPVVSFTPSPQRLEGETEREREDSVEGPVLVHAAVGGMENDVVVDGLAEDQ